MHVADTIRLGYSSCPNDTFMFHALVSGLTAPLGTELQVVMEDIEALNERALGSDPLEITKVSAGVLGRLTDRYAVLGSGAALGRGCGPLLVCRADRAGRDELGVVADRAVAVPGLATTAALLLRLFAPAFRPVPMRFDRIMPAVAEGRAPFGLIIHESRFTYRDHGLRAVADLGEVWERETGLPLPLGVIVAARSLPAELAHRFEGALAESVRHAWAQPEASADYVREHAREMDPAVCRRHIDLYVGEHSADLGALGRAALATLLERGARAGAFPAGTREPFL